MRILFLSIFFFISINAWSQLMTAAYHKQVQYADSLFKLKRYKEAASAYAVAFKSNRKKGLVDDRYRAAVSYTLSGNADSAFYNLFRIAERAGWNKFELLTTDSNLQSLHRDVRWNKLVNKVRSNKAETEAETKGDIP
jgi:hypothetical protein